MNRIYRLLVEIAMIICGLVLIFRTYQFYWLGTILVYFGLSTLVIDSTVGIIQKKKDIKTLAIVFTIFSLINALRHLNFYIHISYLESIAEIEFHIYYFLEFFWIIPSLLMFWVSIKLLINESQIDYREYIKSKEFKYVLGFVFIAILLEFPIFGVHGDFFGGIHGHGIWEAWTHIH